MVQGGSASTCRCDESTQNTPHKHSISRSARTRVRLQRRRLASKREQFTYALQEDLHVELRSHPSEARQPRSRRGERYRRRPAGTARRFRSEPEAATFLVKPACSLAVRPLGTINAPHGRVPALHSPSGSTPKSSPFRRLRLDVDVGSVSTTVSRWPSWPCS